MLPCVYVDGRDTGAGYPSALQARLPQDGLPGMVPTLPADLTLVCYPNTNKGLVEGVFVWFCVYFGFGSFLSE